MAAGFNVLHVSAGGTTVINTNQRFQICLF